MNQYQEDRLLAAIEYAERGWRVLPVGGNKKPINFNGSSGATTDKKQILRWWKDNAFANIGVATGPESFWVIDIDVKSDVSGFDSLNAEFGDAAFDFDVNLCATTPTGGVHLLFQWPKKGAIRNAQGILRGVDIRGEGGYIVVAPSSRKVEGQYLNYKWNDISLPVSIATEWARNLAERQSLKYAQGVDIKAVMSGLSSGERDTELWRYVCHLKGRGVPYDMALAFMSVAAERCMPPFSVDDARAKVDRAYESLETAPSMKDWRVQNAERLIKEARHGK